METKGRKKKLTPRQRRIQKAITYLRDYMVSYDKQYGCLDYSDETFIDDVLYGLGEALDKDKYEFAGGFAMFKKRLRLHLLERATKGAVGSDLVSKEAK
jgi:hypothetical protein